MVLFAASAALPAVAAAQQARPNILIIVTDDQRAANTMGVMPQTLRYFRGGGRQFTNAFATTPLCCPSRATSLTGRYAHNTGVRQNRPDGLDRSTLFPRLLRRAGYRTAMAGKFLNRFRGRPPYFERSARLLRLLQGAYVDPLFMVDGDIRRQTGYSTTLIGQYARRFLRSFEGDDAAPWFLYLAPVAPHHPWTPAPRYTRSPLPRWSGNPAVFERDRSDKPPYVRTLHFTRADAQIVRAGQLRTLMSVDEMVGRLVATLEDLGEKRDTLAIFTSDNGYLWADHAFGGDFGTAGEKRVPYTASVQVPFFLRWPGRVPRRSRDDRLVGNVDIAPTVLSAARIAPDPAKPPLDGRSLLAPGRRGRMLLEYWKERGQPIPTWASLRTRRYQYIEYYTSDGRRSFREYYNLVRDRWQLRNLLGDARAANDPNVRRLQARLARDRRCAGRGASPRPCP